MRCPPNLPQYGGYIRYPGLTWNEAGLSYEWSHPGPDTLATMQDKSPIKHVDSVTAPILLMIGT